MSRQLHVYISGRVQGVGFRFATERKATELGLRGWVRNLPDGNVEAVFQGSQDTLENMLAWCRRGPALARVTSVNELWEDAQTECIGFEVRV